MFILNTMGLQRFLNKNHDVYITYLPDENANNVINTAKKLKQEDMKQYHIYLQEL